MEHGAVDGDGTHRLGAVDARASQFECIGHRYGFRACHCSSESVHSEPDVDGGAIVDLCRIENVEQCRRCRANIPAGIDRQRGQLEQHTTESLRQIRRIQPTRPHRQPERTGAVGERIEDLTVQRGHTVTNVGTVTRAHLPARIDVPMRITPPQVRKLPRQRTLGALVERGVQRRHRDSVVRRGIEKMFGIGRQIRHIDPARLRQDPGHRLLPGRVGTACGIFVRRDGHVCCSLGSAGSPTPDLK